MRLRMAAVVLLLVSLARADFTFVHISDTHFGVGGNRQANARPLAEISSLAPAPAFVIHTGDLCEIGTQAQFTQLQDAMTSLTVPMRFAPGNHDVCWNPLGKEGYTLGTKGPLFQSWDHQNVHFVVLDSTVLLQHWGHISRRQLDWLKTDLQRAGPDRPVVIGLHHWIGRESVQIDNEAQLADVVAPYNIVLWLLGHGHSDIQWNVQGSPAVMVKGLYQGSYNVIHVSDSDLRVRRRSLKAEKQTDESVRDKSVPPTDQVVWTDLPAIPLARQNRPKWSATAGVVDGRLEVRANRGDLGDDAKLEFRINVQKPQPMNRAGGEYVASVATGGLMPGEHVVTVRARLRDGRAFQTWANVCLPGAIEPSWQTDIGGAVQSRLVREGNLLYVGSMAGDLVALRASDGREEFRIRTGDSVFSTPHVEAGVIYFGSADHHVYAADARTGAIRWKTKTAGAVLAGPSVAHGVVCVGSADTTIYGLDAANGNVVWTVPGGNLFQSKTATDGDRFFIGGWDNHFRCIDARSGNVIWDRKLGREQNIAPNFSAFAPAIASPAVGDGLVFVSTNDGILHGLEAAAGDERWRIDWKKMGYSSPLWCGDRVYCALGDDGKVFCADAKTGRMRWQSECGSAIYDSSFAYGGGKVFIATVNGVLSAFDAETGRQLWQYRLVPGHVLVSPAADGDRVYISSMNGKVTALPIASRAAG